MDFNDKMEDYFILIHLVVVEDTCYVKHFARKFYIPDSIGMKIVHEAMA